MSIIVTASASVFRRSQATITSLPAVCTETFAQGNVATLGPACGEQTICHPSSLTVCPHGYTEIPSASSAPATVPTTDLPEGKKLAGCCPSNHPYHETFCADTVKRARTTSVWFTAENCAGTSRLIQTTFVPGDVVSGAVLFITKNISSPSSNQARHSPQATSRPTLPSPHPTHPSSRLPRSTTIAVVMVVVVTLFVCIVSGWLWKRRRRGRSGGAGGGEGRNGDNGDEEICKVESASQHSSAVRAKKPVELDDTQVTPELPVPKNVNELEAPRAIHEMA